MSNLSSNVTMWHSSLTKQVATVGGVTYQTNAQGEIHSVPASLVPALQSLGFQLTNPRTDHAPVSQHGRG